MKNNKDDFLLLSGKRVSIKNLFPLVLIAAAFSVYIASIFNGFVYDDMATIAGNPFIKNFKNLDCLLKPSEYFLKSSETSYRPVATLTYFINFFIWKSNPAGFHLFSILLHAMNVLLVYYIARIIMKKEIYAFLSALIFAVHPIISEAVFCISYNEDLLACLFVLLSFYIYLKNPKYGFICSPLFFFLALLSKEMSLAFPLVVFIYEIIFDFGRDKDGSFIKKKINQFNDKFNYYCGFIIVLMIYLFLRFRIFINPAEHADFYAGLFNRIIYIPFYIFQFIKMTLFPVHLNEDYFFAYPASFFTLENITSLIIFSGLITASIIIYRLNKIITFGIAWFIISLLPVLNIILLYNPLAERYLYIPVAGFSLLAGRIFMQVNFEKKSSNKILSIFKFTAVAIIILACAAIILIRTPAWKDNEALALQTIKLNPKSYRAYLNLGVAYMFRKDLSMARTYFEKSNSINPNMQAFNNLGIISEESGNMNEATSDFKKAIEYAPDDPWPYNCLGDAYYDLGRLDDALKVLKKAFAINPFYDVTFLHLGMVYEKKKDFNDAINFYIRTINANPAQVTAYLNLGTIYANAGSLEQAINVWQEGLKIIPDDQMLTGNINKARSLLKN